MLWPDDTPAGGVVKPQNGSHGVSGPFMRTHVRAMASLSQLLRLGRTATLGARHASERSACGPLPGVREMVRPERSDDADRRTTGRRRKHELRRRCQAENG